MIKVFHSREFNKGTVNLEVVESGFAHIAPKYSWELTLPPFSRLYYIIDGEQEIEVSRKKYVMRKGNVYLIPAGQTIRTVISGDVKQLFFHVKVVDFTGKDILSLCSMQEGFRCDYIEELVDLYHSTDEKDLFALRSRISLDIVRFLKSCGIAVSYQNHSPDVIMAVDYIKEHLSARLTVNHVCEDLFICRNTLNNHFRREFGQSTGEYIDTLLIEKAKLMLLNRELSIGEISATLGFCDQFYFSRRFRQKCGESPLIYRRKNIEYKYGV